MVSQHGLKLAVHLIRSSFGDLVATVCECLLRRGSLTLQQIIKYTELTRDQVTNSLLVLVQHNCVQSFSLEEEGEFQQASKVQTLHAVLFDNIIHRMRFPRFIDVASESEELAGDKKWLKILALLFQHGRCTLGQIYERLESEENLDVYRNSLIKLLSAHLVERCPDAEPFLSLPTKEEAPAKKRGAKSAKLIKEVETTEQRAVAAATRMEALRFSLTADFTINYGAKGSDSSPSTSVGEKCKHEKLEADREPEASQSEREILWRPNCEEFLRRLRRKACVANVRSRLDNGSGLVLDAILKATANTELKVKTDYSAPLSLNSIFEEVIKSKDGQSMTLEHVRASLSMLGCQAGRMEADDIYSIDLKNIIDLAQRDEVESLVMQRHKKEAYKIFRLLSKSSRLMETDKISETAFVEKKEALQILCDLWKDHFVLREVLSTNGKPSFFLWKINKLGLSEHVLDNMYHAVLNMRLREAYEDRREIVGVSDKVKKIKSHLTAALRRADDVIMLFHDF